jgi:AcrR family transcriptional regulator
MTPPTKICPGRPPDEALQRRRREEILDRAAKIFADHGYPRTDVQWIAEAVGVSKGTVYRYFATKQELFLAAVDRGVARMSEHIERAKQDAEDPFDLIRAAVLAYLQFFKKNPELVELFIQERAEFKGKRKSSYFQHRDARRGPWREMVRGLIAQGRIRPMPVERVIDVLGDVLYGTMFTNHFAGRDKPFEAQAEDILDVLFNGIRART